MLDAPQVVIELVPNFGDCTKVICRYFDDIGNLASLLLSMLSKGNSTLKR